MKKLFTIHYSLFTKFFGYLLTLKNYFRTPKGNHDLKDYARALAIIFFTTLVVALIVRRCSL